MLSLLFAFKTQMIYSFGRTSLLEKNLLTLQEFLIIACSLQLNTNLLGLSKWTAALDDGAHDDSFSVSLEGTEFSISSLEVLESTSADKARLVSSMFPCLLSFSELLISKYRPLSSETVRGTCFKEGWGATP